LIRVSNIYQRKSPALVAIRPRKCSVKRRYLCNEGAPKESFDCKWTANKLNYLSYLFQSTEEKIEEVNSILSKFIGTHNYHNFTSGK